MRGQVQQGGHNWTDTSPAFRPDFYLHPTLRERKEDTLFNALFVKKTAVLLISPLDMVLQPLAEKL